MRQEGWRNKRERGRTCLFAILCSAAYGMIVLILTYCVIVHAKNLFKPLVYVVGLGEEWRQIADILGQLKTAEVSLPYIPVLLLVIGMAMWFAKLSRKTKAPKAAVICAGLMLLPLTLAMVAFTEINGICISAMVLKTEEKTEARTEEYESVGDGWYAGFGRRQIIPDEKSEEPFYIAGYNNGVQITGVLDYCEARAIWLDTGEEGVLLIGVDCVALDSGTVRKIRESLKDVPNCVSVNVYATHTHAGIDTLGMWGPIGVDGKNNSYMEAVIKAAAEAGREAAENRSKGELYFGYVKTEEMYRDSREPLVYDENLYQLLFRADNGEDNIRIFSYGAHPESLRGKNTLLSRDYAGMLCDEVTEQTGDHTLFAPGAVGGLIMTKEFIDTGTEYGAVRNRNYTSNRLARYALSITESMEEKLSPKLVFKTSNCVVPMDNTAFWLYKLLGILGNAAVRTNSATGYGVETEVSLLCLDDLAIALIPGEIFPELVYGGEYGDASPQNENPKPLAQTAKEHGMENLLVIGLANDEIGYIVPPSDFLVNEKKPYFEKVTDYKGENHYEETNSVGIACAGIIASTWEALLNE